MPSTMGCSTQMITSGWCWIPGHFCLGVGHERVVIGVCDSRAADLGLAYPDGGTHPQLSCTCEAGAMGGSSGWWNGAVGRLSEQGGFAPGADRVGDEIHRGASERWVFADQGQQL